MSPASLRREPPRREGGPGEETIVAAASPPGAGSLCLLRLSGPRALRAAARILAPLEVGFEEAPAWRALPVLLRWEGLEVPARATVFRTPRSYTGEDLVEIALPGSPPLVAALLAELLSRGEPGEEARLARPGEFTLRAFLSGRIDLTQAEAVAALIVASSEAEGRAAERQLSGELRSGIEDAGRELLQALALLEAGLDFPDEDLPQTSPEALAAAVRRPLAALDRLSRASALRLAARGALRAVLAGFPGSGKSSLLNALLGRPAAIVAGVPGTTRDPVRGAAASGGGPAIEWTDLAGVDPSRAVIEGGARLRDLWPGGDAPREVAAAVSRLSRAEIDGADVIVWVADAAAGSLPRSLAAYRSLGGPRRILVLSKRDLLDPGSIARLSDLPEAPVLLSALRGEGLADLVERVAGTPGGPEPPQYLLTARLEGALRRARASAGRALGVVLGGEGVELAAVDLREALAALDDLTGREVGERVLDEIFGRFCIGK